MSLLESLLNKAACLKTCNFIKKSFQQANSRDTNDKRHEQANSDCIQWANESFNWKKASLNFDMNFDFNL